MSSRLPPEVLFADPYSRPVFHMGPYDATALAENAALAAGAAGAEPDWRAWFGDGDYTLTVSGREAIDLALGELAPGPDDEILIVTTSGSPYISSCVTTAIEKRCRWARRPGPATRAIFLIHEFGFPARLSPEHRALGVPVIEDCAYALGAPGAGTQGDFVIWSFSKALPMPFGGLLRSPTPLSGSSRLSPAARRYAPPVAAAYLNDREPAFARRREVFEAYRARFAAEGLAPLFSAEADDVPHAFVLALADQAQAEAIKPRLQAAGVISSVFYGGGGYYLPNHQRLGEAAVDYIGSHVIAALAETAGMRRG